MINNVVNSIRWVLKGSSSTSATIQTLLSRLLILAINVATGVISARALGPQGRGEQAAMLLWLVFLPYVMTLGIPSALLYNLRRYPEKKSELFSAALLISSVLGMAASIIGIIFMPQWLHQYSSEVIRVAQWFMLIAPLSMLSLTFRAALEAQGEFTISNQTQYLAPLITLTVLGALSLSHALTAFTSALAYTLPGLLVFLWLLLYLWKLLQPGWSKIATSCKQLISYGLRSYGIDLLSALGAHVGDVIVVGSLTPTSLGLYTVALSLSRMLNVFQSSVITVLLPKAAARPVEEVVALTGRAARVSGTLTLLAALVVMIIGPVLLPLVYGSDFMEAVHVFRILVIEVTISGTTWVLAQAFMAFGKPGMVTILQLIGLGLTLPLMLVLIPLYGLEGAGLALLCSTTGRLIFVLMSYPLVFKVRPPKLLVAWEDWYFLRQILQSNKE